MAGYSNLGRAQERQRAAEARGKIPGWAEPFATLGSGMASSTLGGLAALGTVPANLLGLSKSTPADVLSTIQRDYTYAPRSTEGQATLHAIGTVAEKLHAPVAYAAQQSADVYGSPAMGAFAETAPTALAALAGLPSGPARATVQGLRAAIPNTAPSRAGLGLGLRGQAGQILPGELTASPKTLARALALGELGAPADDIWMRTGLWAPTRDPFSPRPPQGRVLGEIPDMPWNVTPKNTATPNKAAVDSVQRQLEVYDTWLRYAELKQAGLSTEEAMEQVKRLPGANQINPLMPLLPGHVVPKIAVAQAKLAQLQAPVYPAKLGDALDHPSLFNAIPSLRNTEFRSDNLLRFAGQYEPEKDRLTVSTNPRFGGELPQIATHEIGHVIQQRTGLPGGMSPERAHNDLIRSRAQGLVSDELFNKLMLQDSNAVYHRAWGEALSNAAMNRLGLPRRELDVRPPWMDITDNRGRVLPVSELWEPYR